jgi:hypothetical protein
VGRKAGLSDDKLRAVLTNDRTSFNDTERLVIELADAMTDTPANVFDDLYTPFAKTIFRRTTDAIGRANRVRELSRTLEPNFQRRER